MFWKYDCMYLGLLSFKLHFFWPFFIFYLFLLFWLLCYFYLFMFVKCSFKYYLSRATCNLILNFDMIFSLSVLCPFLFLRFWPPCSKCFIFPHACLKILNSVWSIVLYFFSALLLFWGWCGRIFTCLNISNLNFSFIFPCLCRNRLFWSLYFVNQVDNLGRL